MLQLNLQFSNNRDVWTSPICYPSSQTTLEIEISYNFMILTLFFQPLFLNQTSSGLCRVFNAATAVNARNVLGSKRKYSVSEIYTLFIVPVRAKAEIECLSSWIPVLLKAPLIFLQCNGRTGMIIQCTNHVL